MKRLYGELNMSWLKVIVFAVAAGIYTGAIMLVPFLKDTSFQDIGINYEWWVIFAVIIAVNCSKGWEAGLKCFLFFLISQPLVYLVEVRFGSLSAEKAWIFYRSMWLPMTILTLPGGFIAYFCKKQNVLGAVILGLGNTIQAIMAVAYLGYLLRIFPRHLLSGIVSVASIVIMSIYIQKERKNQVIAMLVPVLLLGGLAVLLKATGRVWF